MQHQHGAFNIRHTARHIAPPRRLAKFSPSPSLTLQLGLPSNQLIPQQDVLLSSALTPPRSAHVKNTPAKLLQRLGPAWNMFVARLGGDANTPVDTTATLS